MPNLALKFRNPFAMFAPAYPEANIETKYKSPLVPLPTNAFIPQRDLDKTPVLEVQPPRHRLRRPDRGRRF